MLKLGCWGLTTDQSQALLHTLFVLFPARRENLDHLGSLATVREMVMFNGKQRSTITTIRKYK